MQQSTPFLQVFHSSPQALEREITTDRQVRFDENTIIWGEDDALPLRIIDAVNKSPTATACLGGIETFLKGSRFSDETLMTLPIDKDGTMLWQLHSQLCAYFALLDGFAVRFTYDGAARITNTYNMGYESLRFIRPDHEKSKLITYIGYNPYFGTAEYRQDDTKRYHTFNLRNAPQEIAALGTKYQGQIYYYGKTRPPYKFYPVPKYWSGDRWIYADSQLQTYTKEVLDNGFFQSALIKMIGNPNQKSQDPRDMKEVTGDDGVKRQESTKTVGERFSDDMQKNFAGARKAGTAWVTWSLNKDQAPSIESFPNTSNAELFSGTILETIRNITIATEVPAILANLPQQASSLGSDGNSMQKAVELMQARVADKQRILEQFYNKILLPNLQKPPGVEVKILNYSPISQPIEINDKVWEWMNDEEKAQFVRDNLPNVKIIRPSIPGVQTQTNGHAPEEQNLNEAIRNLKGRQLQNIQRIVRKFNREELTFEQAKQLLKNGYGFTDEDVEAWLITKEEEVEV